MSQACVSCGHQCHTSSCAAPGRECGVCQWPGPKCDCDAKLDEVLGLIRHLAARVELALDDLLAQHETHRRVPALEARVAALEARAAGGNGAVEP